MGNTARNLSAVGAWMVAAFIGVGSSVWPELIRPHFYAVGLLGAIGVVLFIYPFGHKLLASLIISDNSQALLPLNSIDAPLQDFRLQLEPHGEQSEYLILQVCNKGAALHKLSAQLQVVGSSQAQFKTLKYGGCWHSPGPSCGPTSLASPPSCVDLYIAKADVPRDHHYPMCYLRLIGLDENFCWHREYDKGAELPYYILAITLSTDEHHNVIRKTYKVGPKTVEGPLCMEEVNNGRK
jgi:hypothetical protein